MPLPDKFFSYDRSIISKFPDVLERVQNEDIPAMDLYISLKGKFQGVSEYIEVLDSLFAMKRIRLNEKGDICIC